MGRPAIKSEALDPWRMAVVNARAFVGVVDRTEIDASNAGVVQLDDNPTNNPIDPKATTMVSLFQASATAIKVIMDLAVEPIRADAVAFIEISEGT